MSIISQLKNNVNSPRSILDASIARTLATMLPQELKAECDHILGDDPEPGDRCAMYHTTLMHYNNRTQHGEECR